MRAIFSEILAANVPVTKSAPLVAEDVAGQGDGVGHAIRGGGGGQHALSSTRVATLVFGPRGAATAPVKPEVTDCRGPGSV